MKKFRFMIFLFRLKLLHKTARILNISLLMIFSSVISAAAMQQQKISGNVTDAENGEPLIGVSIAIEGTDQGTTSDVNGHYSIDVPDQNSVLIFSYMGYNTEKMAVLGQTIINITLVPDLITLQEVVVTALGIKREKKALTYSSQQIGSDDISKNNLNFVSSLSGKIAGVDLRQSNAGAGGSSKITLRGTKSLYTSSQPLFVIDGVPMINYQTTDPSGFYGGRDNGDGLSNLNPDDIESINVLKGANAASLYGSQGANGVIIITTKKGAKGKTKVSISSGTSFQKASILPELQNTYGQTTPGAFDSWGPKGSYENTLDKFFKTGVDLLNTISISGGNDKSTAYFSYANSYTEGIMPSNKLNKNNITFSSKSKFFKNFTVSTNVMLTDQKIHNKVLNGYYWNPLTGLYLFPRGGSGNDISYYKNNYQVWNPPRVMYLQNWGTIDPDGTQQNPWWILNKNANDENTKRVLASITLEYELTDALTVQARGNYDYSTQVFEQQIHAGYPFSLAPENGRWIYSNTASFQQYGDIILNYNKDFGTFDLHGVLGTSYQKRVLGDGLYVDSNTGGEGLIIPNLFSLNNVQLYTVVFDSVKNENQNISTFDGTLNSVITGRDIKESVFANFSVGYKKMIYLDVAARQEWSSTLANTSKNNYFFPSVGLSALINEMVKLPTIIDFAKLRASYSYVGREIPPFFTQNMTTYSSTGGIVLYDIDATGLKPEMQKSLELGAEMRFLNNRVGFEATYYHIDNMDEFVQIKLPSGYSTKYKYINAGHIMNKGVEITINVVPVETENFTWRSEINYSKNINEIIKLDPSLEGSNYALTGGGDGYNQLLNVGGSIGDLYVIGFKRDATGNIVLGSDSIPQKALAEVFVGNANPKFTFGWNNTITYKNISLNFLIDGKFGGKFIDMTEAWYDAFGVSKRSADARDLGYVLVSGVTESGVVVTDAHVNPQDYYTRIGGRGNLTEQYVYDATNIRLRNVALTYHIALNKYNILIENASVSLTGQNLFFFYREAPFDPDNTISTGQLGGVGNQSVESFNLPPTRSYGFNIKLNF